MVQPRPTRWMLIAAISFGGSASAQQPVATLPPLVLPSAAKPMPVVRLAPEQAPAPKVPSPPAPSAAIGIPITLDTVLRLAQDQNGQVRLARSRLEEACIKNELADRAWMPEVSVGPSYNRHEGGIQDFQGRNIRSSYGAVFGGVELRGKLDLREVAFRRVEAERNLVQRRGELSKLSSEQLLDASATYVDLLAAQSAIAISLDTERKLTEVLKLARSLESIEKGLRVEVVRIESEREAHKLLLRRFQEGAKSAQLKLLHVLGIDSANELAVLDALTQFRLIDDKQPPEVLVEQALRQGPGVEELNQLLALVDRLHSESQRNSGWIPTVEVTMAEGAFGAGPGTRTDWENRWDFGVHLRWSINGLLGNRDRQRLIDNQRQQAHLGHQELRSRLSLGVRQAIEELRSNQDQLELSLKNIRAAEESYKLSDSRLRENIRGRSPSEVLLAARSLFAARISHLHALRDYDKAQLRLFVLVGLK